MVRVDLHGIAKVTAKGRTYFYAWRGGPRLSGQPGSPEFLNAAHTGLRLGDLLKLSWSHIGEDAIIIATGKSRGRRDAIIPLYRDLRDVLARIPKRSTTIVTNKHGRPWRKGFGSSFSRVK
jgi:hypothetical protein